jgi:hypothetical protein
MKMSPMPARLHASRKKPAAAAPALTRSVEIPASPATVAETTPAVEARTYGAKAYGAKEEIRDAIAAADRSMSKCYATLRRLRTKLK